MADLYAYTVEIEAKSASILQFFKVKVTGFRRKMNIAPVKVTGFAYFAEKFDLKTTIGDRLRAFLHVIGDRVEKI